MLLCVLLFFFLFFFFKQKTAYEMRISDWSSDVCSSDLRAAAGLRHLLRRAARRALRPAPSGAGEAPGARRLRVDRRGQPDAGAAPQEAAGILCLERSEERRVGKECVSKCISRWTPYH